MLGYGRQNRTELRLTKAKTKYTQPFKRRLYKTMFINIFLQNVINDPVLLPADWPASQGVPVPSPWERVQTVLLACPHTLGLGALQQ